MCVCWGGGGGGGRGERGPRGTHFINTEESTIDLFCSVFRTTKNEYLSIRKVYNIDGMPCLVVDRIKVRNFATLFNCTSVDRTIE